MIELRAGEIVAAVGGRLAGVDPEVVVRGPVVIDSRLAVTDSLFVCLVGEHTDGHEYAGDAVRHGAALVLAARPTDAPTVVVDDPEQALGRLAAEVMHRSPQVRVTGVTGSSGKTSTKDLIAEVMRRAGPTVAAAGSYNNELGLPLTVLDVETATRQLVLEYSARDVGHIRYLTGIARPDTAVVLNVGSAHLGEFGSREVIAAAKGELIEALAPDGVAILNVDDELVAAMAPRASGRVVTVGTAVDAEVRIDGLTLDDSARARFSLVTPAGEAQIALRLVGEHHAGNAAAAAAAGLAAGLPLDIVADALREATPRSAHRMAVSERSDGLLVVDDAYNANPESMRAAVLALAELGRSRAGRSWAVLGEMRELGDDTPELHAAVGRLAAGLGVDHLVVVGDGAAGIAAGARSVPGWSGMAQVVADPAAAAELVAGEAERDDVVLVKASNALRLWTVAESLTATGRAGGGA